MQPTPAPTAHRPPSAVARDIRAAIPYATSTWTYTAPYVAALAECESWTGDYYQDSVREVALRFLCNAGSWRGPKAKALKNEVRRALGMKEAR